MSILDVINTAIDRKLNSKSFANVIEGEVVSTNPIQVSIDDRLVIGQDFLDFNKSLLKQDSPPDSALYNVDTGDRLKLIRYQGGQRYYVIENINKPNTGFSGDYVDLDNKPKLNTVTSEWVEPRTEEIEGTLYLHRVAKTGSYNSLRDKPTIPVMPDLTPYAKKDEVTDILKRYQHEIQGASGTAQWYKIGDFNTVDAQYIIIDVYSGNGYNARPDQNSNFRILIKDSWQSTLQRPGAYGTTVQQFSYPSYNLQVQVRAQAHNRCEVWVYLPWTYFNGMFIVEGNFVSYTFSGQRQTTAPTDDNGILQATSLENVGLQAYPVGSIFISTFATSPEVMFGGTWERYANGRVLVGVAENDSDFTAGKTGGHKDLQAHTHEASTSIANAGAHTHSVTGTAASAGAHTHGITVYWSTAHGANGVWGSNATGSSGTYQYARSAGAHTHSVSGTAASAGTHNHPATTTVSSSGAGNGRNMQPYIAVYMWRRTA